MDDHVNNDNRIARIGDGRWKKVIHTSLVLLGAAALVLLIIISDDGYGDFRSDDDGDGGEHRGLLRVLSRRRTAEETTNCNRFHRQPSMCNQLPGCTHNKTACVPSNLMTMNFAEADADKSCKKFRRRRKCRYNHCAWDKSTRKCEAPRHECDRHKGKARACNKFEQCIYNSTNSECELMSQTKATATTVTTQAAGSTQCWEWHPLPGEQTPTW